MRFSWRRWFPAAVAAALLTTAVSAGQQATVDEGKRRVKTRVNPQFSDLARRMNLTGKVKIELVIAPDGRVKNARAIGGHPVLIQSCLDAVREWRFEPSNEETTQVIEFDFRQ